MRFHLVCRTSINSSTFFDCSAKSIRAFAGFRHPEHRKPQGFSSSAGHESNKNPFTDQHVCKFYNSFLSGVSLPTAASAHPFPGCHVEHHSSLLHKIKIVHANKPSATDVHFTSLRSEDGSTFTLSRLPVESLRSIGLVDALRPIFASFRSSSYSCTSFAI